jgi:hypothetical protein
MPRCLGWLGGPAAAAGAGLAVRSNHVRSRVMSRYSVDVENIHKNKAHAIVKNERTFIGWAGPRGTLAEPS